jgi:LmbE family N-acetylglucosaminyl deacetylase
MNVLAIGAHFDDVEIGCGGTVAKHIHSKDKVIVYVATKSGYKNPEGKIIRSNDTAFAEGKKAIQDVLGAKLICGSFDTLKLDYSDELFRELLAIIEHNNIDLIYTHWIHDIHHDHNILSKATMHVSRHIPRVLMYKCNWYDSTIPFKGNFFVDISNFYHKKEQAIKCHKSEIKRTSGSWINYFKNEAINLGYKANAQYAEVFEVVRWLQ